MDQWTCMSSFSNTVHFPRCEVKSIWLTINRSYTSIAVEESQHPAERDGIQSL
jgi:hypothetical protein